MIDKVPIEPSERSEDARDLIDVLDRILDKGIVVDPLSRLNMMDRRQVDRFDAQGRSGSLALARKAEAKAAASVAASQDEKHLCVNTRMRT